MLTGIECEREERGESEVLVCARLRWRKAVQEAQSQKRADLLAGESHLLTPSFVKIL